MNFERPSTPRVQKPEDQKFDTVPSELSEQILKLKQDANLEFEMKNFQAALNIYTNCLELLEQYQKSQIASTIHYNMSLCYKNLEQKDKQLQELYKAIDIDTRYRKARVALANLFTDINEPVPAQIEWQNVQEISELNESEKKKKDAADKKALDATLQTLKGWGNKILRKFGMSLNDFKM